MSLTAAVIRELVAAGLSGDALVDACARIEASDQRGAPRLDMQAERRRAADRERKRAERLRNSAESAESADASPQGSSLSPTPPISTPNPSPDSPKKTPKGVQKGGSNDGEALLVAEGVPEQVISDWLAVRKAKKAGPITITVATQLIREAEKTGISPAEAVKFAASRGWQGFFADWHSNSQPRQGRAPPLFASEPTGIAAVIHHLEARTR